MASSDSLPAARAHTTVADAPLPELSGEQLEAKRRIMSGTQHVFLGGKAGTGKTTLIKAIRRSMRCMICAPTGAAALNAGGVTIDALFSINRDTWEYRSTDRLWKNMAKAADTIIIDEASMMGGSMAKLVGDAALDAKKRIIMVGDLAQASPVKDTPLIYADLFRSADQVRLRDVHRQSDVRFLEALNEVREGRASEIAANVFRGCVAAEPDDDSWTRLYATNALTDGYNNARLAAVMTPSATFKSQHCDLRNPDQRGQFPLFPEIISQRLADSRLAHNKQFKVGAQVILTRNVYDIVPINALDPDSKSEQRVRFVNGDTGVIMAIEDSTGSGPVAQVFDLMGGSWSVAPEAPTERLPEPMLDIAPPVGPRDPLRVVVRLDRTGDLVDVPVVAQNVMDPLWGREAPVAQVWGFPITLGWACSIHRAQGASLDRVYADMGSICHHPLASRHGLAYVALSRARTLPGLRISGWRPDAVYADPATVPYL